ncbi:MAG: flagellar hook-basal body complex protein FliE [Alphaproteobacteria bacterium]|nr:flagellar hook-basal body complex protein FliE [Alphaproteobacteria bacterium]
MELSPQNALLQNALTSQLNSVSNNPLLEQAVGQSFGTQNDNTSSFKTVLSNTINEATESQRTAEELSRKALVGEASLTELVPAVLNAESTLRTVTAVRDRVVEAYREILRTPI